MNESLCVCQLILAYFFFATGSSNTTTTRFVLFEIFCRLLGPVFGTDSIRSVNEGQKHTISNFLEDLTGITVYSAKSNLLIIEKNSSCPHTAYIRQHKIYFRKSFP